MDGGGGWRSALPAVRDVVANRRGARFEQDGGELADVSRVRYQILSELVVLPDKPHRARKIVQ